MGVYDRPADWPRRAAELPAVPPPHGVLLADPADFEVLEIHNPHMAGARGEPHRVDADAARAEWLELAGAYSAIGQRVEVLPACGGLPDLCFAANPSLLLPLPGGCEAWLARMVHPRALIPVKLGGQVVENHIIFAVLAYMLVYGVTMTAITLALTGTGMDFVTAFSASTATVNNLGPGLGNIGPAGTYAAFDPFQTWICTAAMLVGRLELITVFVLFTPAFWRK